jgi:hypothetical protein
MKIKLIPILFLGLFAAQVANADALSDKIREDMLREIAENHARDLDGIPMIAAISSFSSLTGI